MGDEAIYEPSSRLQADIGVVGGSQVAKLRACLMQVGERARPGQSKQQGRSNSLAGGRQTGRQARPSVVALRWNWPVRGPSLAVLSVR